MARLPGVTVLSVSFAKSRAEVLYDPAKVTIDQMKEALGRYGYQARPLERVSKPMKQIVIRVEDFGGFDKIPPLEKALRKIPGVEGIDTDPLKREITVTMGAKQANQKAVVSVVTGQGLRVVGQ